MSDLPGLLLALRTDADRVFVVLTDFRALACQGWAQATVPELHAAARAGASGSVLHGLVLPADVAEALAAAAPTTLTLQLPLALDPLPLEALDGGRGPLGARFAVVRQLVTPTAAPDTVAPEAAPAPRRLALRVLGAGAPGQIAAALAPPAPLAALAGRVDVSAALVDAAGSGPAGGRADVLVLGDENAAGQARALAAALPSAPQPTLPPALWVWSSAPVGDAVGAEGDAQAALALRAHGHAVLLAPPGLGVTALLGALQPWLAACADGAWPAQALRGLQGPGAAPWRLYHAAARPLCLPPGRAEAGPPPEHLADDHRPVTALSFDLVDSTGLVTRLDGERYSEMLVAMHALCVGCVRERGGVVADRKEDDGSMAYFGVPRALEDAATRALDAALAMHAAVSALPGRPRLRIGVTTGRVTVRSGLPYGTSLHLAARLRQRGTAGDVLVDKATVKLAGHRFVFDEPLPAASLAGIAQPVPAWRLAGPRTVHEAVALASTPFVGREAELADLQDRWRRAGEGHVVALVVRGEPGVGKTRLVREFTAGLRARGQRFIELRGLPETQGSAFRALIDAVRHSLGLRHGSDAQAQRDELARALAPAVADGATLQRVWRLLGLDAAGGEASAPPPASGREREQLIAALADLLALSALAAPLALLVEDLPWIDPSTREVLQGVIDTPRPARLLVLCTQREDEGTAAPRGADTLSLGRLSQAASRWLIREAAGEALPPELVQRLAERGDGVPLFLEESARMAVEAGGRPGPWLAEVPVSLQGLLMARLDRLGARGKLLTQVAAVTGRDFPAALFEAVATDPALPLQVAEVQPLLTALQQAGVLQAYSAAGVPRLGFHHELIRDVAYWSLWQRDRVGVHAAVARALTAHFPAEVASQPDWLAHHLAGAGRHGEAMVLLEKAARAAAAASANREAIRHLRAALDSLAQEPPSPERDAIELRLLLLLASRLIAAEGYGAEEVGRIYARADTLAQARQDRVARGKVLLGLESVHVMRGELDRAEALATQVLDGARAGGDRLALLQARWALANVRFHRGDSRSALALINQCLASYTPAMHHPGAVQDPGVMCLCYGAWALWEEGSADAAQRRADEVIALARQLEHRFSLGEAYGFAASVAMFRGEVEIGRRWADLAVDVCEAAGFTAWLAHARIVRGRLRTLAGERAAGEAEMEAGYRLWTSTGAVITRAFYLTLMAESRLEAGDPEGAAQRVDEARGLVERCGERYHAAEVLRLAGQVALAQHESAQGEALLRQAAATAQAQGKRAFALRAATALGRHLAATGRAAEAVQAVDAALAALDEGLDTHDPRQARALRAAWAAASCDTHPPAAAHR